MCCVQYVHDGLFHNVWYREFIVHQYASIVGAEVPPLAVNLFTELFASLFVVGEDTISHFS